MTTSTTVPDQIQTRFAHAPMCVPMCVPRVSSEGPQGTASSVCPRVPSPTEGTHTASPPAVCPADSPKPWFQTHELTWRHPNPNHPSTTDFPQHRQTRTIPCPLCGAPANTRCVTKNGTLYDGTHKPRAQAAQQTQGGAR